ncbi:hypothetical protein EDD18DRAFT_1089698 [Armillaria luteobubalina]|uniref:Uncharacterized protein n=1 Tax=Armillaria luteobubalina TaxID=153913 RepID=A0AA39P1K3_9AGAR|nr:hypothetical protein EDD18DRAFT_1089698 [Armillaria luteobubalina]
MHKVFVILYILLLVSCTFGVQESPDNGKDQSACIGDQRTVLSIIWSCLATIFACTWLAVHPNVPGCHITSKGTISCAIERTKIMAITILAPEIIVGWAAEQFFVAWKLCHDNLAMEKMGKSKLTLAHGFLLNMGGFYYTHKYTIDHKPAPTPLSSILPWSVKPRLVTDLAAISPETIEDRSKGDALSKTISILQLSWFIVQCIARALQHLPITLLEVSTLAFTSLTVITYSLWWYKPPNVKGHDEFCVCICVRVFGAFALNRHVCAFLGMRGKKRVAVFDAFACMTEVCFLVFFSCYCNFCC